MTTKEVIYTNLSAFPEIQQTEQPAASSQRCADWISYAVAVTQQAAPTAADFSSDSGFSPSC
ncbi:hypothetical protein Q5H92_22005 [Hymenobacter sp. M29]|uniref:Uncharacterized protein n=1 Tax=Hymenobacter mellowenesis TaxID=3063995 RepID=A0ABT9AGT5_9BACT|nr:hypothetical protein [Hymenobacter sp. M29]MDO7849054.1 hypothetical protein [Hymenobacter sp. M29]